MKIYKLPTLAEASPNGEYRLGHEEAETGTVYIVYGRLRPGQTGHRLTLDEGHEEIICVVKGTITVRSGKKAFSVSVGEAFNPGAGVELVMDNTGQSEAIFISARADAHVEKAAPPRKPAAPAPHSAHAPEQAVQAAPAESEFEITNDGVALED